MLIILIVLGLWAISALRHIVEDPLVYHQEKETKKCYIQRGMVFTGIACTELVLFLVGERLKKEKGKVKKHEPRSKKVD